MVGSLRLRPCTVRRSTALGFVQEVHRRLPHLQGGLWAISVRSGGDIVGVAIVGHPSQVQTTPEMDHLRILRVAVLPGYKNACSMLYGACWRAARAMGATSMDTFTHLDELGTSLRAAGWVDGGLTAGGEYDRPSRARTKQVDASPKRRWWAPGSTKIKDAPQDF